MRLEIFKNYQQVHIWTGILSGLLLFICFVAGALTMFKTPLNQWALQADNRLPTIEYAAYDELIQQVLEKHPEAAAEMTVYLPGAMPQQAPVTWLIEDPQTHAVEYWQATLDADDKLVSEKVAISAIGDFLDHLHRTAGIPGGDDHDAVGIFVMGVVSMLYFVAIVSGLIIFLPGWFKDLFAVRKGKNSKRFWVDFHNILGITALPFHIVIAVTTIVFAYHDVLYGAMQQWVYKDAPMFSRPAPKELDLAFNNLVPVDELRQTIQTMEADFEPEVLRYAGLGTPRARVLVGGNLDGQWIRGPEHAFWVSNPYTAESGYTAMLPSVSGVMGKIVNGFFTLHFGGFGGGLVHWLYFAMGLSGSLLFLTGNIIWIEARRKKQNNSETPPKQRRSVVILARLTVGVTLGTLAGIGLALLTAKLLPHADWDIAFWQMTAYYVGFLGSTVFALVCKPIKSAKILLLTLCSLLLALIAATLLHWDTNANNGVNAGVCLVCAALLASLWATQAHLKKRQQQIPRDSVWS